MRNLIREFRFGRPQQLAALLLVALIALCASGASRAAILPVSFGLSASEVALRNDAASQRSLPDHHSLSRDSSIAIRAVEFQAGQQDRMSFLTTAERVRLWFRLPFILFCTWLAAALWWVTRRLYNDRGAFVALGLFCFSLPMIAAGARINADIIAAWGLYGLIYTAIGVAHTLYAPARKWRPRIVLLGVALGVSAGAHLAAAVVGIVLAAAFMLYLAPGRRAASLAILAIASGIATAMLFVFYGFDPHALFAALRGWTVWGLRLSLPHSGIHDSQTWLLVILTAIAVVVFFAWRWTRYFGNIAPLVAATVLLAVATNHQTNTAVWALPFIFTFIGGIMSDLMESSRGRMVRMGLWLAMAGYAAVAIVGSFAGGTGANAYY